jgi:hypothetical protein
MNGTYTGVVDRFEGDDAVLLLEREGDVVGQAILSRGSLPEAADHVDAVLEVTVRDDKVERLEYDPEATENRRESAQDRFDRLSERPPDDDS